jgi:hypothetical protein
LGVLLKVGNLLLKKNRSLLASSKTEYAGINIIKYYKIKWWGYVERIEDQRISKILFKYNRSGKREPGRPQKKWNDQLLI